MGLNILVFMNLMIDMCSRLGSLVATDWCSKQYLWYLQPEVYAFRPVNDVELEVNIKIEGLKGMKGHLDLFKEVGFHFLPG